MAKPHLFQRATVSRIIKETADARTYVLAPDETPFPYQAGQFCTFKVHVDGDDLYRSYSMSSAPETDSEMATTVKRVPGGKVSNWMLDNVVEGDEVTITRAAGTFCLADTSVPLLGFSGGSGVTPILSLVKSALATTDRQVRLLCADKDRASVIFDAVLDDLVARYPDRLSVVRHIDAERGLLEPAAVVDFVGADTDADCYVCGPEGFMSVVTSALPGPGRCSSRTSTRRLLRQRPPTHPSRPRREGRRVERHHHDSPRPQEGRRCRGWRARRCWRARVGRACRRRSRARPATAVRAWRGCPRAARR